MNSLIVPPPPQPTSDSSTSSEGSSSKSRMRRTMSGNLRERAEMIRRKSREHQEIRHKMRTFRRCNSTASADCAQAQVQQDAQAVEESLKAMEAFMQAVKTNNFKRCGAV